ncbi:MAG: hypothetical protein ACRD0N_11230 [Acidimicrobiales bacterium]
MEATLDVDAAANNESPLLSREESGMAAPLTPGDDDLRRQRRRREARLLAQPVSGFAATSVGDVVMTVMAATEESGGAVDPQRFLAGRGHCWQTIETVLAYLDRHERDRSVRWDTGVAQ